MITLVFASKWLLHNLEQGSRSVLPQRKLPVENFGMAGHRYSPDRAMPASSLAFFCVVLFYLFLVDTELHRILLGF